MVTLYIKNMVCSRCVRVVREELSALGIEAINIKLGEVLLRKLPENMNEVIETLARSGFELLESKSAQTVEAIKAEIIDLIYRDKLEELQVNLSQYLSEKLGKDYSTLSKLFSDVESTTIEQFFIIHKIERVKEFIVYDELNLSEIAYRLGYSSVQHLSNQFKKTTGLSPSHFKKKGHRHPLDGLSERKTIYQFPIFV